MCLQTKASGHERFVLVCPVRAQSTSIAERSENAVSNRGGFVPPVYTGMSRARRFSMGLGLAGPDGTHCDSAHGCEGVACVKATTIHPCSTVKCVSVADVIMSWHISFGVPVGVRALRAVLTPREECTTIALRATTSTISPEATTTTAISSSSDWIEYNAENDFYARIGKERYQ